ncbi:MAG: LysR family transcriptional regulator [Oceanospirillaceae bacterium]|nr:LysR family transcriptional regulator [Oceanospirillaceae bacterium]
MINLNDMLLFARVVDTESFTAAANVLEIPKSTISRRISNLEKQLGTRLLERTTRRLNLTEAGTIYYQHCKRVIAEAESAEACVNQLIGKPTGTLRVNTSVTIGQHLIAPLLAEFLQTYPDIDMQLLTTNRIVNLIDEGFDIVIRAGAMQDSSLISKYLGTAQLNVYASHHYLEKFGEPTSPEELVKHACLTMSNSSNVTSWQLINEGQEHKIMITSKAVVYDFSILKQLVVNHSGIAMLPSYLVLAEPFSSSIKQVLKPWAGPKVELHAVYPSRQGITPKIRVFLDFVAQKFAQDKMLSMNHK